MVANYGFMETPDIPEMLQSLRLAKDDGREIQIDVKTTSFYLGRETLIPVDGKKRKGAAARLASADGAHTRVMGRWRKKLFIFMTRNAQSATAFFGLPPNRVVELGAQIQF